MTLWTHRKNYPLWASLYLLPNGHLHVTKGAFKGNNTRGTFFAILGQLNNHHVRMDQKATLVLDLYGAYLIKWDTTESSPCYGGIRSALTWTSHEWTWYLTVRFSPMGVVNRHDDFNDFDMMNTFIVFFRPYSKVQIHQVCWNKAFYSR